MRTTRRGGSRRGGVVLSEQRPRSRRRRALTRIVLALFALSIVVAGYLGYQGVLRNFGGPRCQATALGNSVDFDPSQTGYAATITGLAVKRGLPPRAATIAIATAIQESKLRNLRYGDRDSLGLFQQRPSQGWGTAKQILDMVHATNAFYDALVKFKGYETADITTIAQKVQRSGFPEAYRDHEGQGRVLASTLTGHSPAGLTCRLDAVRTSVGTDRVASDLAQQMGITSVRQSQGRVVVTAPNATLAWAVAHWGVARAEQYGATRVAIGDRVWDRSKGDEGWSAGSAANTVTITLG